MAVEAMQLDATYAVAVPSDAAFTVVLPVSAGTVPLVLDGGAPGMVRTAKVDCGEPGRVPVVYYDGGTP